MTGLWYLDLTSDPAATLPSVAGALSLAHAAVAAELVSVTSQAAVAVWFYQLFRRRNPVAAWGIAAFGVANAVIVLFSAVFLTTAVGIADDAASATDADAAAAVALLFRLSAAAWSVGAIFFGLWLIPMGYAVVSLRAMPVALGCTPIVGGVGYVLSAFVDNAWAGATTVVSGVLTLAATVGEFWMIGYLLAKGIHPEQDPGAPPGTGTAAAAGPATSRGARAPAGQVLSRHTR